MSATFSFSATTTAEDVATALSLEIEGKNVLVTGTSIKGIGFETARVIAQHANLVVIADYNQERLKLSEEAIKKENPRANIYCLNIDLSSLANVRKAAAEINALHEPLHVLINNAAVAFLEFKLTEDGLDIHYATNHVGPFLFTKLLTPKLLAAASPTYTPRVVFVASMGHTLCNGVNFDTLTTPDPAKYSRPAGYSETKTANILTASELAKRAKGKINAYSLHPGIIFTNGFEQETAIPYLQEYGFLGEDREPITTHFWKTLSQGAATTIVAAFDPRLNDKSGAFLVDCDVANDKVAPHGSDPATAERLWNITEKIIGEEFTF